MRTWIIGAVVLALTVTAAPAVDFSANYLMQGCRDWVNRSNGGLPTLQGVCAGIVMGIVDASSLVRVLKPKGTEQLICLNIPDAATVDQEIRVILRYIDSRPERMNERFSFLALEALRAAWPCK